MKPRCASFAISGPSFRTTWDLITSMTLTSEGQPRTGLSELVVQHFQLMVTNGRHAVLDSVTTLEPYLFTAPLSFPRALLRRNVTAFSGHFAFA